MNNAITIYHNPNCGTSRNTLAMIRNTGIEPTIIEYVHTPPSFAQLQNLIQESGLTVREAIRSKEPEYLEYGLDNPMLDDHALLTCMLEHPILINRPFVVTNKGTRLCRPSELVLEILTQPPLHPFKKEDGEIVWTEQDVLHERFNNAPALDLNCVHLITNDCVQVEEPSKHPPRILLLYGSLRERSYSRFSVEEAGRILTGFGAETRIFHAHNLPLVDETSNQHPKVQELYEMVEWCEGMVWCSPERHGAMSGVMKTQIDWIPLTHGAVRPTQGKTLAVMQVSGGSQSFNAVNQMRILGRWMRLLTIPNQSSVAKAYQEFNDEGRMRPSPYYDRIVDVMEELYKFTLLTRDNISYFTDRYSERKESAEKLRTRANLSSL